MLSILVDVVITSSFEKLFSLLVFSFFFSSYLTLVYQMNVSIDIAHDKVYIRPSCHLNYGCSISYITKTGISSVGGTPLNPLGPYQTWNGDSI